MSPPRKKEKKEASQNDKKEELISPVNNKITDYIRNINALARKLGTTDVPQKDIEKTISYLTANNYAWLDRIISHMCSESANDECKFLAESAVLFFRLLDVCTVETSVTESRRIYLSSLLDHLCTRRANPNAFALIRNVFAEQLVKLPVDNLTRLIDTVAAKVKSTDEDTAANDQWADIIGILFIKRTKKEAVEEPSHTSSELSMTGCYETAKGFIRFESVNVSTITRFGIYSPEIELYGMTWRLNVKRKKPFLAVFLHCRKSNSDIISVDVSVELSLINIGGKKNQLVNYKSTYSYDTDNWGTINFIEWKDIIDEGKGFIKDNKITIEARFTLTNIVGIRLHPRIDFTYAKNPAHDVALIIDGQKIYVNKGILAVHSDFFNILFYGPFAEKDKQEIELNDVNREEFIKMLNMIYPSYEKITDDNFESLLKLADQFQIKIILDKAEQFLIESAKLNVTRKLKLSDEFRLVQLQDHCLDSLKTSKDIKDLKYTDGYKELSKNIKGTLLEKMMKLE